MNRKPSPPRRILGIFELEDLLLALWMLAVEQLVINYFGRTPVEWAEPRDGSPTWPLAGLLLAAAFVIFTRGSLDTSIDQAIKRRVLMFPPLLYVLPLFAALVSMIRGGEKSIVKLGGDEAEWPMPAAPDWLRRLVATPILLVADSAFLSVFEVEQKSWIGSASAPEFADAAFTFFMVAPAFLIFVAGPRIAAGSSGDWKVWLGRFALYAFLLVTGRQLASVGGF